MRLLALILGAALALAVLQLALKVALVLLVLALVLGLLFNPQATLANLGAAVLLTVVTSSPTAAALGVVALLLAGLVAKLSEYG